MAGRLKSEREVFLDTLRLDFLAFAAWAITVLRAGAVLERTWVIDALCEELRLIKSLKTRRLIVNMPPRSLKSTLISAIFVAWWLGHNPHARIICVSYNDNLAVSLTADFRKILMDLLFREIFPGFVIDPVKNNELETRTTAGGYRFATTVNGTLTGRGADMIIVDDPLNAANVYSAAERERVNTWFDTSLLSRLDNQARGVVIVVMQRLHENDLTGHLLGKGSGWRHFCLPARNLNDDRAIPLLTGGSYLWPAGEDLLPTRLNRDAQDQLLANMGQAAFSAQYLQEPLPAGGTVFKTDWIKSYPARLVRSDYRYLVLSFDVAVKPNEAADYTVCTVWGVARDNAYHLLEVYRARLAYFKVFALARSLIAQHRPTHVLVEDAANGAALAQELAADKLYVTVTIRPRLDKLSRAHAATPAFESGRVLLPEQAEWRHSYIQELTGFPGTRHDDQVDSTSQFINWAEERFRNEFHINVGPGSVEKDDSWMF